MRFRFLLSLSILLIVSSLTAQQGIQWSPAYDVSTTAGNASPKIGILGNGSPAIVWGKNSTINFSKMVNGAFSAPMALSNGGNNPDIYSFGGLDMAVKGDLIFIVFENFNDGVFTIKSTDAGESFDAPVNVYDPVPGKWATLSTISIDENNNPLVSVILQNANETDANYILMRSTDGGTTYSPPTVSSEPADGDAVCECCTSDIYTKGSEVYVVFRNNINNLRDMWVSKSIDNGANFSEAVDVDATDWILNSCPISGPKIAPLSGDSLITIWKSAADGPERTYISTLNSETMEKGFERVLPLSNMNASQSSTDVAGLNDTIGIVWSESGFGANGTDLIFALSKNGSQDLFTNFANLTEAPFTQSLPDLVFFNGIFHIVYTNASGLQYKKGIVSDMVSSNSQIGKNDCFKLLENPIYNGRIGIGTTCSKQDNFSSAQLTDLSGRVIFSWVDVLNAKGESFYFDIPEVAKGLYIFSLKGEGRIWSEKIMIK